MIRPFGPVPVDRGQVDVELPGHAAYAGPGMHTDEVRRCALAPWRRRPRCGGAAGACRRRWPGRPVAASGAAPAAPPATAARSPRRRRARSIKIGVPSLTRSPTLTSTSRTAPAAGEGTSIVALSDSSVTSGSSALTTSPGLTWTSMTGTSLKSPMSGTLTSVVVAVAAVIAVPLRRGRDRACRDRGRTC